LDIRICEVDAEQNIVFAYRRTQQQGTKSAEKHLETRQVPRFIVEYPLLAKPNWLNVAAAIEDCESVAVQQDPGSIVSKSRRSSNVELLIDLNDVPILFTLSSWHHR
jgi:hypothetical protein